MTRSLTFRSASRLPGQALVGSDGLRWLVPEKRRLVLALDDAISETLVRTCLQWSSKQRPALKEAKMWRPGIPEMPLPA